jgi:hypothetical protein
MTSREELEALSAAEVHDRATHLAWRRLDVGFLWGVLRAIPEARAAIGDEERSETDIIRPLALLNDFVEADQGELAEALRPLYVEYLLEHEGGGGDDDEAVDDGTDAAGGEPEEPPTQDGDDG